MHERSATRQRALMVLLLGLLVAVAPLATAAENVAGATSGTTVTTANGPTLYPRNMVWWPYASGPYYGDAPQAAARAADVVITDVGSFRIDEPLALPAQLMGTLAGLDQGQAQYFVVQLKASALAEPYAESLTSMGAAIVDFMPVNALVLRMDRSAYGLVSASPMVQFIEPYHPAYKISPAIGRTPQLTPEAADSSVAALRVRSFRGESEAVLLAALQRAGATVTGSYAGADGMVIAQLEAPLASIPAIAKIEGVQAIAEAAPILLFGDRGAVNLQSETGNLGYFPYWTEAIQGDGQIVTVVDTGTNVSAGDKSNTRSSSGWTGGNGAAGPNVTTPHRKITSYAQVTKWAGQPAGVTGDLAACDVDGKPHGSLVVGVILGNGTRGQSPVPDGQLPSPTDDATTNPNRTWTTAYGTGFWADTNQDGQFTELPSNNGGDGSYDGVAKGAKLVFVDAQTSCPERLSLAGNLEPKPIIDGSWTDYKSNIFNFSLGPTPPATGPDYTVGADSIDAAVVLNPINLVVVAVGNAGEVSNGLGNSTAAGNATSWAACKNCIAAGGSNDTAGFGDGQTAEGPGPGATGTAKRHVVHVLAESWDNACRATSNNATSAPTCANYDTIEGTSVAAANLSGSAAVIREYFAEGFYPDGTDLNADNNANKVAAISSTLIRALMIAGTKPTQVGKSYTTQYRYGHAWGYGQFFLSRALPLASFEETTAKGLIVHDLPGNIDGVAGDDGVSSLPSLPQFAPAAAGSATAEFNVTDVESDLSVALTWLDRATTAAVADDLNLDLTWCGADQNCGATADNVTWIANAFTDDIDQDGTVESGATPPEIDFPPTGEATGWYYNLSDKDIQARGGNPENYRYTQDNMEAVFVSTYGNRQDADRDGTADIRFLEYPEGSEPGTCAAGAVGPGNCARTGKWRISVSRKTGATTNLAYAVAIAGPVVAQSQVRLDRNPLTCNDQVGVVVTEIPQAGDTSCGTVATCPPSVATARTTLKVLNPAGAVVDTETNIAFGQKDAGQARFESNTAIALTTAGTPVNNDGVLTIQSGYRVRAEYADNNGTAVVRTTESLVDCKAALDIIRINQLGPDAPFSLAGGCDGDNYLDVGESFTVQFQFYNVDPQTMYDAQARFSILDATTGLPLTASEVRIEEPVKKIGTLFSQSLQVTGFAFTVLGTPTPLRRVDLQLCISSAQSGLGEESCRKFQTLLQANNEVFRYITDCPTGCTLDYDFNFDEKLEDSIAINRDDPADNVRRNRDETQIVYSNLTVDLGGGGNPGFNGPWDFDSNDEGFRVGVTPFSKTRDPVYQITNWGEDLNFDGTLQPDEDRDPNGTNGVLDRNWNTRGGCGWMTKAAAATAGGIWHTGSIGTRQATAQTAWCGTSTRENDTVCERYNPHDGTQQAYYWWEGLRSPTVRPVHWGADANGFDWKTQILAWQWNMQWDAGDNLAQWIQEFDLNLQDGAGTLLGDDLLPTGSNYGNNYGLVQGGQVNVYSGALVFAPTNTTTGDMTNGTIGGNRAGERGCYFNDLATEDLGKDGAGLTAADRETRVAFPTDDDCDNEWSLGPDGSPGARGVDDDLNGLIDDTREICPCKKCGSGPRAGQACVKSSECNPTPPASGRIVNFCVNSVDVAGKPTPYGDDVCGDGTTDEGVAATFGTNTSIRQGRNWGAATVLGQNILFNTYEDIYGPAGREWAGELSFIVSEGQGAAGKGKASYGMAIDDMVIEWQESHPIAQAGSSCTTADPVYKNEGNCAQISVGTVLNATSGDSIIPVAVNDPVPSDNVGACTANGQPGVEVLVNSLSERGEKFCLAPVRPGANEFKGEVKTTTRANKPNDGYVFISYNGNQTPSITINYVDKNDGLHPYNQGVDGQPGIAGFDDDNDGTVDNSPEWCPTKSELGPGRSPHLLGRAARYSDDNCGCLDNPVQAVVQSFFDTADLIVSDVRIWDAEDAVLGTHGDGDGYADPNETVAVSMFVRNLSDFPIKDLKLRISSDSPLVKYLVKDEIVIPDVLGKNNPDPGVTDDELDTRNVADNGGYFKFVASDTATRTSTSQDLTSLWTVSLAGTAQAGTSSFFDSGANVAVDVPLFGTNVVQQFRVVHNLNATITRAADYSEDFESYTTDAQVVCPNPGGTENCDATTDPFVKRVTGDDVAELRGTYCQDSDPFNPLGVNSTPIRYCELGNGFSNAITENHWHLQGPGVNTCERGASAGCPDGGRSSNVKAPGGKKSLASGIYKPGGITQGDNNITSTVNRMYWVETASSFQLGIGSELNGTAPKKCDTAPCGGLPEAQAPVLEYWTEMSILDTRLVSASGAREAFEAALVYVCVDKDGDNACDTKEDGQKDGSEKWEPIRAYKAPESAFRDTGGCMWDPSDDGSTSSQFFQGSTAFGPSSTCFPLAVDSCVGRTWQKSATTDPFITLAAFCWPETGDETLEPGRNPSNGAFGNGKWIQKLYNLKGYRGQRILVRWHVSPSGFPSIGTCMDYFTGGGCGNRDDGWFVDDIRIYGMGSGTLAVQNTPTVTAPPAPPLVSGLVARLAAIEGNERNDEQLRTLPAAACSDTTSADYCDFDNDGAIDKVAGSNPPVNVTATAQSDAPGRPYLLTASETSAASCLGGALEYRVETSTGTVLRDWLTNTEEVRVAPAVTTTYVLRTRCTAGGSESTANVTIQVGAPVCTVENLTIGANYNTLNWVGSAAPYDVAKGSLAALLTSGNFSGASCLQNNLGSATTSDAAEPAAGQGFYYVVRCDGGTWNDGKQTGNRDTTLTTCP